jgi:hypothetical protein
MTGAAARVPFCLLMRWTAAGWFVEGPGHACGPFSRDNALNLAEGMVEAVRQTGQLAELVIQS